MLMMFTEQLQQSVNEGNRMYLTDQGKEQLLNLFWVNDTLSLEG